MKTTIILGAVAAACLAVSTPGVAQTQRPNLGGGFIELLLTGRDPGPRALVPRGASPGMMPGSVAPSEPSTVRTAAYQPQAAQPYAGSGQIERAFDPRYERQVVEFEGTYAPGTILIDTEEKFLFLVQPGGRAIRYGIGVGRPGFLWTGNKSVTRKAEWPDWTPPAEMLKRRPDLPRFMEGGPENPMGARALYLGSSLYRIHGTNEPHTIGHNVSSGCIRMLNEDVVDLYNRVRVGTRVVVI
ncbi:MAG: L,D-transpeptidase [Burkholderiales bacterium]|nr:L,D-transpeptidase [Burkholderiales bacterium]